MASTQLHSIVPTTFDLFGSFASFWKPRFSYDHCLERWQPAVTESDLRIRILELHPSRDTDANSLEGTLTWVPLSQTASTPQHGSDDDTRQPQPDTSSYKALSYTWGNRSLSHSITVNGALLKITRSLFEALSYLQSSSHSLRIWIDQICINQQDLKEKAEQVSSMDRIYQNSEEALVWLGPAADGSDELLDVITRVGTFAEVHNMLGYWSKGRRDEFLAIKEKRNPNDSLTKEYHAFCEVIARSFGRDHFDAFISLYQRPWFLRAWVVQEFSLPPRVTFICGDKRVRTEILMMGIQIITTTIFPIAFRLSGSDSQIGWRWSAIMNLSALYPFLLAQTPTRIRKGWRERGQASSDPW